jgi:hypothetical protein
MTSAREKNSSFLTVSAEINGGIKTIIFYLYLMINSDRFGIRKKLFCKFFEICEVLSEKTIDDIHSVRIA